MQWIAVALGGALGSVMRYGVHRFSPAWFGAFPGATFIVNIFGSLLLGILWGSSSQVQQRSPLFLGLGIGALGGFTTFSTFSLDTIRLYQNDQLRLAAIYVLSSVLLSLIAAGIGIWLGLAIRRAQ